MILKNLIKISFVLLLPFAWGCSSSPRFFNKSFKKNEVRNTRYFKIDEDKVDTLRNLPPTVDTVEGYASFYSHDFNGEKTANGETFNMYELTAAHRTYPFNTMIRVTNLANNKSVIVRINDRGPVPEDRIIDLSLGAAIQLGMKETGVQKVRLEILEWGIN